MAIENTSKDLSDFLATKNFEVKYKDAQGNDSSPEEAKVFAFDWIAGSGKNYGTVVIVLGDDNDFQFFFGDNVGKTMSDPQDKLDWFGSERHTGFLEELSRFAVSHRYLWSPKNINQLKHTMQGMAAIKEGLFEGYYGTRTVSYMGERTDARLMIKHNRMIGEDDKRYRYVESLFIETADGERFKLPFTKLTGGRAMLEHVRQGGKPYDIRGQHINEVVTEMAVLSRFNRARQGRVFEGITQELVESANQYYQDLQESLKHMATARGYARYFESWTPADIGESTALVEDLKTLFIEQTLDTRIEAALPTLAKIQHRGLAMKEAQIFENWINNLAEGTWDLPDTPEAQAKLDELMSKELIVGPDATNATEQLYDIIGDDELFDILHDLAENDPRANIWDDTDVQARLQELGIQMNTTPAADQQQPVAPAAGEQAPGTEPEQAVREGVAEGLLEEDEYDKMLKDLLKARPDLTKKYAKEIQKSKDVKSGKELNKLVKKNPGVLKTYSDAVKRDKKLGVAEGNELARMLEHAGVNMQESKWDTVGGPETFGLSPHEVILRFPHEVRQFMRTGQVDDDLYHALYDWYNQKGMMPYGIAKDRDGDSREWIAMQLGHECDIGLEENLITAQSMPVTTESGSCNMTAEGEYCPEHGLAECGYMEGMAPVVMDEAPQDAINYNAAITGSYYESKDGDALLARIKSLALLK